MPARSGGKPPRKTRASIPGLELHRGKYRWRPMIDGTRHTIPLVASTEAAAIAEVLALKHRPLVKLAGTWEEAVHTYLRAAAGAGKLSDSTSETRGIILTATGRDLHLPGPRSLTPAVAKRWLQLHRDNPAISSNTLLDYAAHLRAFCKWCVDTGRMSADPTRDLALPQREDNTRDVFLEASELATILTAARTEGDRDLEWIIALGCECGMRRGEICACRPDWFNLTAGTVTIPAADTKAPGPKDGTPARKFKRKGREGRRKPATIPLSAVMLELIARHGLTEPFIVRPKNQWGKSRYRFEFRKKYIAFMADLTPQRLVAAGDTVTIHDLRRSFGSNRVSAGVSLEKIANWMGISRATAEKRYLRFVPADPEINRGAATHKPAPTTPTVAAASPPADDPATRLARLDSLHAAGLITADERATKRAEILASL